MKKLIQWLLPLIVIALSVAFFQYITSHKTQAKFGGDRTRPVLTVEAMALQLSQYQVKLESYGVIKPRTAGALISQVEGKILSVSPKFREGAFFEQGDVLLQIDDRDYRASVDIAKAELIQAELGLAEEQARSEQALRDWKRLGKDEANALVLRKPQLAAAQAAVASAKARLTTAQLQLQRTKITAPYAGRLLQQHVDLGEVVSPGTELGEIFAVDFVEVRLPLKNRQLEFIDLPEQYRDGALSTDTLPNVELEAVIGQQTYHWQGQVVRVEGAIDETSRQLFVVAQVEDPYGADLKGKPPLKIGQFVRASITGHTLSDVFVLPRQSVSEDNSVLLVVDGRLQRHYLEPLWQTAHTIVTRGLEVGQVLNLTPLGAAASGTAVKVNLVEPGSQATAADTNPAKPLIRVEG